MLSVSDFLCSDSFHGGDVFCQTPSWTCEAWSSEAVLPQEGPSRLPQCLALHQDLGPEAGGSSPSLSMVVFYLNYYCWTILYFPKINLFISYWNLSCEADCSSLIGHGGGLAVVPGLLFYLWTVNYNSLVNTSIPRRIQQSGAVGVCLLCLMSK